MSLKDSLFILYYFIFLPIEPVRIFINAVISKVEIVYTIIGNMEIVRAIIIVIIGSMAMANCNCITICLKLKWNEMK